MKLVFFDSVTDTTIPVSKMLELAEKHGDAYSPRRFLILVLAACKNYFKDTKQPSIKREEFKRYLLDEGFEDDEHLEAMLDFATGRFYVTQASELMVSIGISVFNLGD